MGSGKSTVLNELVKMDFVVVNEPARQILSEQRAIQGQGVPDKNANLFVELLLSRAINQYNNACRQEIVLFDRGIADNIAYAEFFGLDTTAYQNAGKKYKFNGKVFFLDAIESIYCTDDERKMSFSEAKRFGNRLKSIYQGLGYEIIELPFVSPRERAYAIINHILQKYED